MSKILEQFGLRVQKSIFICDVSPVKADEIKFKLKKIILEKEDSLLIYPVCETCCKKIDSSGTATLPENEAFEIL